MHLTQHQAGLIAVAGNEVDVREQHRAGEIAAFQQQARRDPATPVRPAGYRGGPEQLLSQRGDHQIEVGNAGHAVNPQLLVGRHHQFRRTLDVGAHAGRAVKVSRQENRFQKRLQLVAGVAENGGQLAVELRRDILTHQVPVELGGQEFRSGRLRHDQVHHLYAVVVALVPQETLRTVVVLRRIDDKRQVIRVPAGECARRFTDVPFAVVAHAHGEKLHDFAGEILVRRPLDVYACIKEIEHRRILRHRHHQVAEVASGVVPEGLVLQQHLAVVADLGLAGGEMAVPEQRHFFFQGPVGVEHAIAPPVRHPTRFQHAGPQPVEELVDHRLQGPVARRLHLDP